MSEVTDDTARFALAALTRVEACESVFVCPHALNGRPIWICAEHPALGGFCEDCHKAHVGEWHASLACSVCGSTTRDIAPVSLPISAQLIVCDLNDRVYSYNGPAGLMWACCTACAGVAA